MFAVRVKAKEKEAQSFRKKRVAKEKTEKRPKECTKAMISLLSSFNS